MKKIFFLSLLVATLFFVPHVPQVFAQASQGFTALAPIPGLTATSATSVVNSDSFGQFFNNLYKYLIGLAAILAIIEIIWGGLELSTKDSVSKQSDGKARITEALLGLVLVLMPVLVFSIINPSILNLSIKMDAINAPSTSPVATGSGSSGNSLPSAPATGCSLAFTGPNIEVAVCANFSAATNYKCTNGTQLRVPPCPLNAAKTACADDKPVTVSCSKAITLTVYRYVRSPLGLFGDTNFVPSDVATANSFKSDCEKGGGVYSAELTNAARLFIASGVYTVAATNGCSSDYGVVIDRSIGEKVACFGNELKCNAPS